MAAKKTMYILESKFYKEHTVTLNKILYGDDDDNITLHNRARSITMSPKDYILTEPPSQSY